MSIVPTENRKILKQKRMIFQNLKDLYKAFKEQRNFKISFSRFCSLHLRKCKTVNNKEIYSVSICTLYENVKLVLHAICIYMIAFDYLKTGL